MIRTAAIVGTGLIGTSVALALTRRGVRVHLLDIDPLAVQVATALGAGSPNAPTGPTDLAVLAVPPSAVPLVLAEQQARRLAHSYTDVASVKNAIATAAVPDEALAWDTYIGGHPMAGGTDSGPLAARSDLFEGRAWVLTPTPETSRSTFNRGLEAVALCGAVPVIMDDDEHDRAVALVSHAPHAIASLLAARLPGSSRDTLRLADHGLHDATRIAGGDPRLWSGILEANASAVADVLGDVAKDLDTLLDALRDLAAGLNRSRARTVLGDVLERGLLGWESIRRQRDHHADQGVELRVALTDQPGELARLIATAAELGVGRHQITADGAGGVLTARVTVGRTNAGHVALRLAEAGLHTEPPGDRVITAPDRPAVVV
ncbi:prephenate dehydrogenase [Streptomyces scopuliridis]|uniref:prephenate dehydrogenase n=1 Tax=Streptomyces scopuliridis TaxID=452529 RepID=UPI0034151EC5